MNKAIVWMFALVLYSGLFGPIAYAQGPAQAVDQEGHPWWQHAVFYEIYPRSFADSNNDGVGDLKGIASKLDYLKDLGVDAIWISPCFPSPQVDFGYDVSDYENIDPMYGTLADFDRLVARSPGWLGRRRAEDTAAEEVTRVRGRLQREAGRACAACA